jgi:1-hydroxycarotenoid 3,4-desaturase
VAKSLADLAGGLGAKIRYDTACIEILVRSGRACGVRLANGDIIEADSVVFNGDAAALGSGMLGSAARHAVPAIAPATRSLSALTWSIHAQSAGFPLVRHNVFFAPDYASEFRDIFERARLPRSATVYVCAQDRDDNAAGVASTAERLLCLVNAPANGDLGGPDSAEIERCEQASFSLMRRCGLTIERTGDNTILTTPEHFNHLFPGSGGALYGQASHGWMASFRRPSATCALPGLYLAGGSVHPGPGVPMAAMSGRLAAATLMAHLDSTSRSGRVVISGGISTHSATTGATA